MQETQQKQLRLLRLQAILMAGILVLLLAAGAFLAVQAVRLNVVAQRLDMASVNRTIAGLEAAADSLSALDGEQMQQTVAALQTAAQHLSDVDMASLNEAIEALSGAAENLKELDIDAFNALIASLQASSENLEKATGVISGIFGR